MGYKTRQRYLQHKKKAEDKISAGSIDKIITKKQVQLSPEDLKIIDLIRARSCIHIPSIQANVGGLREETIKRRMDILVSAGIVKAELSNARKRPEIIYYLGKRVPYNEISHALYMSEALDRLRQNPHLVLRDYKHEHILKSEHSKARQGLQFDEVQVPDGGGVFERAGEAAPGFLEIDSKSYTGMVLRAKVTGLAKYIGNRPLYWICYSTKRFNTVKEAVRSFTNIIPIMFYDLNSL